MDISDQLVSGFIKVHHLDVPRRDVIADVALGRFGTEIEFQDGSKLSLNVADAWSTETDNWLGKELEMYAGKAKFGGKDVDSVMVRPISPAIPMSERPRPKPRQSVSSELNDEVPF